MPEEKWIARCLTPKCTWAFEGDDYKSVAVERFTHQFRYTHHVVMNNPKPGLQRRTNGRESKEGL